MADAVDLRAITHDPTSSEQPTPEQLQQLLAGIEAPPEEPALSELEKACAGAVREVIIPCIIELEDGRKFEVNDLNAWAWTPFGVYAVGRFEGEDEEIEKHQQFSGRRIIGIELQPEAFTKWVEEQNALDAETPEEDAVADSITENENATASD